MPAFFPSRSARSISRYGCAKHSMAERMEPRSNPTSSDTRRQVLIVDDDEGVRGVAVRQLTSLGYRVTAAANGAEALALLERLPDIDLLFTDLTMPGMDGHEVAERARRARPGLKVLFASGNGDSAATTADGATARYIVKPYRKKELAETLLEVLVASATE